jgi:hypothetical protein
MDTTSQNPMVSTLTKLNLGILNLKFQDTEWGSLSSAPTITSRADFLENSKELCETASDST